MTTAIARSHRTSVQGSSCGAEMRISSLHSTEGLDQLSSKPAQVDELEVRLREALRERDEQWRKHEKAQIAFLQTETASMLKGLHAEIERLSNELRETKRKLFLRDENENYSELQEKIEQLEKDLLEKETYTKAIEKKVTKTIEKLQEQISLQSNRIRQLNDELNDRNQTVAHLSQQLRQIKLREAMATAQQRRRASQSNSPLVSPSSPHRIFPPIGGVLSTSVSITYPGSPSRMPDDLSPGSIEKPSRRSFSAMRAPRQPQ